MKCIQNSHGFTHPITMEPPTVTGFMLPHGRVCSRGAASHEAAATIATMASITRPALLERFPCCDTGNDLEDFHEDWVFESPGLYGTPCRI